MQPFNQEHIIFKRCSWLRPSNNIERSDDLQTWKDLTPSTPKSHQSGRKSIRRCFQFSRRRPNSAEEGGLAVPFRECAAPLACLDSPGGLEDIQSTSKLTTIGVESFRNNDFVRAKRSYEAAAEEGDLIAIHNLGTMHLHGQGIQRDYRTAYNCFKRCSEGGLSQSMSQLGYMYLHGRGVAKSVKHALYWFAKSAKHSNTDSYSHFHLGMLYILGIGVAKDVTLGCEWLKHSANEGFAPALYNLAVLYMNGLEGVPQNMTLAATLLKRAAALQDPYSQNNLAILYARGVVVKQDYQKALKLFSMAAKQGISAAMFNLAEMYSNGLGVPQDATRAARYYLRAATTTENAEAEFSLACIFLTGKGPIEQDLDLSFHWFEKAASHGHKGARNNAQVLLSPHFNAAPPVTPTTILDKQTMQQSSPRASRPGTKEKWLPVRFESIKVSA